MTEWIEYTGSDEQIEEMKKAENGFLLRFRDSDVSDIQTIGMWGTMITSRNPAFPSHLTHYLICEPQPYADMICQWARTGQPVWVRYAIIIHEDGLTTRRVIIEETNFPNWNIPGAEYSFTPFEERKECEE